MPRARALDTITRYYDAFNEGDTKAMERLLGEPFAHHVNEGKIRHGIEAFREFNAHMSRCYREQLTDMVIMANDAGTRGAAEFIVNGVYLETDDGLPEAHGQSYVLPAGAFFTLDEGKITRVVTYYNLADWIAQVS
ncbi:MULTISPECIES: ketosteroid isomerase-related protein [Thioclava]|uniref:Isopropylmalate/homocitrate/citramalate synthase n=1 Tax=Thioclava nitratireducens TaxID=1915078 RepID=A0ABN4X9N3_9RHOB|nr:MULTISPECIES: ketosteroid isomerase-related protein [Thioclava]AQS47074.1 isopropylmalate/homocitrate/citramalate synthase [Thioclava nitratireducens]OWY01026.1 isopropylmalate/homocitrate/citramalate synthase [Thioclava sp. IC9]OWY01066.1 isopropylmalate/homocitrate/citramalate synthase [Thioclava sp. F1Mire-8]OWY11871.1 isopropylmalate/homocitrate/citramalate synthase [Thioclava sp. F34-6]OWY13383.1 isopropylmalate/homocitrate/citramalate synthase [Thioclava sp. JM3]